MGSRVAFDGKPRVRVSVFKESTGFADYVSLFKHKAECRVSLVSGEFGVSCRDFKIIRNVAVGLRKNGRVAVSLLPM